jgi:hypothetical protein
MYYFDCEMLKHERTIVVNNTGQIRQVCVLGEGIVVHVFTEK